MRGMMGSFLRDGAGGAIPLTSVGIIEHQDTLGEDDMDARDLFLDQHAVMHSAAVGGNKMSAAERTFAGLTDEQMRVRPREDLNSLAWLMWHMTSAEVTQLTGQIDPGALRAYRDAVGLRTRELVGGFKPQDWQGAVAADAVERAATAGAFGARTEQLSKAFPGRPRAAVLSGIALIHSAGHMGEAATGRTAGGFGSGILRRRRPGGNQGLARLS